MDLVFDAITIFKFSCILGIISNAIID